MTTDKQLLKSRFSARLRDYDSLAVVQDAICGQLAEMTGRNCTRPVDSALEIGSGTGFLTRRMLELYPHALWTINDLVEQSADFSSPTRPDTTYAICGETPKRSPCPTGWI